jgi:hypothetical protein
VSIFTVSEAAVATGKSRLMAKFHSFLSDTNVASEYANNTGGYDVRFVVLG